VNTALGAMIEHKKMKQNIAQERKDRIEDAVEANIKSTQPMVEGLKALDERFQEQNQILQSQIDEVKKSDEETRAEAKEEAKKDRNLSWIQFSVATAIAIAALVVSIIALFV
jgi:coenzyme F420-reducing hydrogenase alpha subunit